MRGNQHKVNCRFTPEGSIPACAGEPARLMLIGNPMRVYPRVCGGTRAEQWQAYQADGLSPRVRGNPMGMGNSKTAAGSIPACAGEPGWTAWVRAARTVYPRVCGGTPLGNALERRG